MSEVPAHIVQNSKAERSTKWFHIQVKPEWPQVHQYIVPVFRQAVLHEVQVEVTVPFDGHGNDATLDCHPNDL